MAVYKNDTLIEQSIYGSSRLGLMTATSKPGYRTLGGKKYELSNHLGNVLAVVSDNIHLDQDSTWASVINSTDYYPFGLAMDGRSVQDSSYRYGFNGKDEDSNGEWGSKSHYDYGFRIYNLSIAKFLSVDPLNKEYPELTPFQFASNTPIQAIDLDGLEAVSYQIEARGMYGIGVISIATSATVGLVVDFDGNLAGFYTPTLGVGAGEGFIVSSSLSFFKNAKSVKDIEGMGFNAGAFYAVPGVKSIIGGGEINLALRDDLSINKVGGTVSGSFIPGPNIGIGIGGYFEGAYTFMTDVINI
ncbi:RHS repeat domain-containing protein [Cyclobacterium amurskyense]|uniref:RHS repeat-associated core domain-containing protein n=1 Tax=Cyclobacterium amurskyense TaxID=320787 RepID=A0A0H4PL40_9BACT|nr:RHS repeat-associated core domain-containing protein [Cyclobacterium amurskyense]AKP53760.1 hypothetical protein CA2015_4418 [Cyclobacterium amurskyense]